MKFAVHRIKAVVAGRGVTPTSNLHLRELHWIKLCWAWVKIIHNSSEMRLNMRK